MTDIDMQRVERAEAFRKLIMSAKLLLQNAQGCAVDHYGHDFALLGTPGWLADCERDILAGEAALQADAASLEAAREDMREACAKVAENSLHSPSATILAVAERIAATIRALPLPRSSAPVDAWRHVKTGGVYERIGECRIEATNTPAFLYRGADGTVWARPKDEFLDGRFERVEPSSPSQTVET